jgi:hypothetical protein
MLCCPGFDDFFEDDPDLEESRQLVVRGHWLLDAHSDHRSFSSALMSHRGGGGNLNPLSASA